MPLHPTASRRAVLPHRIQRAILPRGMNVHHLELFYYVARFGGISRALRHIPYGIQQPAVSGQLRQLEQQLGAPLFTRRPFSLTPAGEKLLDFVRPFFGELDAMERSLREHAAPQLRIGASEIVLRNYLPPVMQALRRKHPTLRVDLRSGYQPQLETWLADDEIDVAITGLERRPPRRLERRDLLEAPLALLIARDAPWRRAEELLGRARTIDAPLIALPASESITQHFIAGLKRRHCTWPTTIVASSLDLVATFVAQGCGVGVGLALPEFARRPAIRVLPLVDFEPIHVAALCRRRPSELVQSLLHEAQRAARRVARALPRTD